jgi:16S rRNA (adenine1518-N6/adenine1519-N6)-dimethyltransferase
MSAHPARKRFGQHFLIDPSIIERIVASPNFRADERVVEIGPGLGALTGPLLRRLERLQVIEIDRDIVDRLRRQYPPERLIIHAGDALNVDFAALANAGPLRLIGNLPYNVSTPLLFHLARFADVINDMHFMLQKEVVDRLVAAPASHAYGRLSVMLQYRFAIDWLFDVPPQAFTNATLQRWSPPPSPNAARCCATVCTNCCLPNDSTSWRSQQARVPRNCRWTISFAWPTPAPGKR